jgi:hypothetical protein
MVSRLGEKWQNEMAKGAEHGTENNNLTAHHAGVVVLLIVG